MLIAICDDESIFRKELRSIIFKYKAMHQLHIDVYEYPSGEALLASRKHFDIVFLDYQMSGMDGMETARTLREKNYLCSIVFVTAFPILCKNLLLSSRTDSSQNLFVKCKYQTC